ncbi:MAG: hypothetical protein JST16_10040 [Bdellovibrionales bacterium]|nr:hypothetical protein [Bdellovibrionales bacterium]
MKIESAVKFIVIFANVALSAAFALAWVIFGYGLHWGAAAPVQVHLAIAGIGVLFSLFANLCVIFYFIGSGVWIRDQARGLFGTHKDTALKVWSLYEQANKLKGKAFPFPTFGLVLALFAFVLGGATQVGAIPHWLHPLVATLFVVLAWAGVGMQFRAVDRNLQLLDEASDLIDALEPKT